MTKRRKRRLPLELRAAGNLLLLAAMAALVLGMVRLPRWILEQRLRMAQAAAGLTGRGELLWEGRTCTGMAWRETAVYMEDGKLFVSWQDSYEGGYSFPVYTADLPGGPVVAPVNPTVSWTAVRAEQGEDFFYQLMAADLPEGAAGGRLAVTPGPGAAVRTVEGTRDRGIVLFRPGGDWLDIDVRNDTAWTLGGWGSLKGKEYALTLWDEDGAVISETGGTLDSIWEKAAR